MTSNAITTQQGCADETQVSSTGRRHFIAAAGAAAVAVAAPGASAQMRMGEGHGHGHGAGLGPLSQRYPDPLIQVIDNFVSNHKLGLLAETKAGKGGMLICAIDLLGQQDKPEARQLLHSLLRYVASPAFAPKAELDAGLLRKLLPGEIQGKP